MAKWLLANTITKYLHSLCWSVLIFNQNMCNTFWKTQPRKKTTVVQSLTEVMRIGYALRREKNNKNTSILDHWEWNAMFCCLKMFKTCYLIIRFCKISCIFRFFWVFTVFVRFFFYLAHVLPVLGHEIRTKFQNTSLLTSPIILFQWRNSIAIQKDTQVFFLLYGDCIHVPYKKCTSTIQRSRLSILCPWQRWIERKWNRREKNDRFNYGNISHSNEQALWLQQKKSQST